MVIGTRAHTRACYFIFSGKMQRSLDYFFNKQNVTSTNSADVVPKESSSAANTSRNPLVLTIGARKRPVGRPKKPIRPAAPQQQLVDYSSTDTEESANDLDSS